MSHFSVLVECKLLLRLLKCLNSQQQYRGHNPGVLSGSCIPIKMSHVGDVIITACDSVSSKSFCLRFRKFYLNLHLLKCLHIPVKSLWVPSFIIIFSIWLWEALACSLSLVNVQICKSISCFFFLSTGTTYASCIFGWIFSSISFYILKKSRSREMWIHVVFMQGSSVVLSNLT